jgi:hypothetical protein
MSKPADAEGVMPCTNAISGVVTTVSSLVDSILALAPRLEAAWAYHYCRARRTLPAELVSFSRQGAKTGVRFFRSALRHASCAQFWSLCLRGVGRCGPRLLSQLAFLPRFQFVPSAFPGCSAMGADQYSYLEALHLARMVPRPRPSEPTCFWHRLTPDSSQMPARKDLQLART